MQKALVWLTLVLIPPLTGCSTPPEVKQLSVAQIKYFDTAIEAVRLQSEALIIAAERIQEQAEARITETEKQSLSRFERLAVDTIPSQTEDERKKTAEQMLEGVVKTNQASVNARQRLAEDLAAIKAKTQELEAYIAQMKEVQVALDAYLQSEQAGEQWLRGVLKQPSVQSLLATANDLLPKVTENIKTVKALLSGLGTGR